MPTKQVVINGTMTWTEEPGDNKPPQIWGGGNVPMPSPPIHLPGNPPGIWGPNDPRPSNPIANVPGMDNPNPPGFGARPEHPIYYPPNIWGPNDPRPTPPIHIPPSVGSGSGGSVAPPAANVPIKGSIVFVPGYGWMFVPDRNDGPKVDNTLPGDLSNRDE